jgi:hypothetical protein
MATSSRPTKGKPDSQTNGAGASWREDLARAADRLLADDELRHLRERLDDVGALGDLVVAAHLDDLLFVERARYQRARREVGRALALGTKEDVAVAQARLSATAASLGVFRLQRDVATGDVELPVDEPVDEEPVVEEPGDVKQKATD